MIHDKKFLREIARGRPGPSELSAVTTVRALCDVGIETVVLSQKLFDNTHKMLLSAATNKDAKDVSRTMSAFFFSSYRDLDENVESVSRIWRRYFREAVSRVASV
ncbi:hypothetical protein [Roseiarcus sp.]|uniref:hypothetical protein n=1 Tax=Roseiarcus sp. TaxID=1969460 RepID=UPI003F9E504A